MSDKQVPEGFGNPSTEADGPAPLTAEERAALLSKENSVENLVPPRDELKDMSDKDLESLKEAIVQETVAKMLLDPDFREKLRLQMEKDSAINEVEHRGQFADPALKVIRSGSLGPIDHQEALAKPYKTDPSMTYRFINKHNQELFQLRRLQGYDPIRDEEGNEVRYMDGVLAQMPQAQYDETIGAEKRARKMLKKQAAKDATENFIEVGARHGVKAEGGVKVDITKE